MKNILIKTNSQKILDFLIQNPGREYLSREIQKATKISKAGTNFALNDLRRTGLIERVKRGKVYLYIVNFTHPVVRQLKVLKTVISLISLLDKIKEKSKKIILYGSAGRGENSQDSDIDLFVVTNIPDEIEKEIRNFVSSKNIQLTMRTPLRYVEMEKTAPVFYKEVERGLVLWEEKDES